MSRVPIRIAGRTKYRAQREGKYASKKEARRAAELALMERIGEISQLQEQVSFVVVPIQTGESAVIYRADFVYLDKSGTKVVEDVKGFRTKEYIIKRKLMLYRHGIKIQEL